MNKLWVRAQNGRELIACSLDVRVSATARRETPACAVTAGSTPDAPFLFAKGVADQ